MEFLRSLLMLFVAFTGAANALQTPPEQVDGKTASQWVEELAGEQRDTAIAALAKLGASVAAADLAACIESRPAEHTYQASRALLAMPAKSAADRLALDAAAKRIGALLKDVSLPPDRAIAVLLSLAAIGERSALTADEIVRLVRSNESAPVFVAAAAALRSAGAKAAPDVAKLIADGPVASGFCVLAGSQGYGESATALVKPLTKLIGEEATVRAELLLTAAYNVLNETAGLKKAEAAFAKRSKIKELAPLKDCAVSQWVLAPPEKVSLRNWLATNFPAVSSIDFEVIGLQPETAPKIRGFFMVASIVSHYGLHFAGKLPDFASQWQADEFKTLDAWKKAAAPLSQAIEFVGILTDYK